MCLIVLFGAQCTLVHKEIVQRGAIEIVAGRVKNIVSGILRHVLTIGIECSTNSNSAQTISKECLRNKNGITKVDSFQNKKNVLSRRFYSLKRGEYSMCDIYTWASSPHCISFRSDPIQSQFLILRAWHSLCSGLKPLDKLWKNTTQTYYTINSTAVAIFKSIDDYKLINF